MVPNRIPAYIPTIAKELNRNVLDQKNCLITKKIRWRNMDFILSFTL